MKWVCSVCGYVHEGDQAPEKCPQCKVPADKFIKQEEGKVEFADKHVVGVAQGVDLKSACTGKRLPGKKLNTLLNLQSY